MVTSRLASSRWIAFAVVTMLGPPLVAMPACAHRVMKTPMIARGSERPLPNARPSVEVFYATDRMRTRSKSPKSAYAASRGQSLRLGVARLTLGQSGDTPESLVDDLRSNRCPKLAMSDISEFGELGSTIPITDPRGFAALTSGTPDPDAAEAERAFAERINAKLGPSGRVIVYVPGFNTSFSDAVLLVGELGLFLEEGVVPVAFSWPARDNPLAYSKQLTSADVSRRALRELLTFLAKRTDAERIDLMSYSAGAVLVTDAVHQLRLMHRDLHGEALRNELKLGTIIYAGADEDLDRFRSLYLDGFGDAAENITLYSSSWDLGLLLSRFIVRGSPRLGRAVHGLSEFEREVLREGARTRFIDVTYAQSRAGGGGFWSHGYWFGNPWVSSDVVWQLRPGGAPSPGERGLVLDEENGVWRFPRDYPERAAQTASHSRDADQRRRMR
ncbi:MAG: alpha/beta hydrolase [Planctomycetota bacterium]